MVPTGTPASIVERLHAEIRDGLARPELRGRFTAIGLEIAGVRGPEAFMAQLRELWATFGPLIKQLGIRAE